MIVWISTISWMSTSAAIVDVVRALRDLEHGEGEHREAGADGVDVRAVAGDHAFALEPIDARVHRAAGDADRGRQFRDGGVRRAPQGVEQSQIGGVERPGHGVQPRPLERRDARTFCSVYGPNIGQSDQ